MVRSRTKNCNPLEPAPGPRPFVEWAGAGPFACVTETDWLRLEGWPEAVSSDVLERVLTLEALSSQPARSSEEICQRLCDGIDPERLALVLQRHPAWVALPSDDGSSPRFLPRKTFVERLLWVFWRGVHATCDFGEQTFTSRAARQAFGLRNACGDAQRMVLDTLASLGLAEEDEHGWSIERVRALAAMCRRLGLTLRFQVGWDGRGSPCATPIADDPTLGPDAGFWTGLSERDAGILKRRWAEGRTLEEVGDRVGLTKERVRQIEKAAKKDRSGLRQRHMNRSFARALGKLPSCRLVQPEALVMTWENDLGVSPTRNALFRLLERQLNLTPVPLCDGELWWLPFEDGLTPSDEVRWTWETEGEATPALAESGARFTTWEREAILNCRLAREEARTPRTMRDRLVQVLRSLGRPSRLSDIRQEVMVRYPQYVADTQHVYGVLNRHPDVFLVSGERGVYGLRGMEALLARETLELPLSGSSSQPARPRPVTTPPVSVQIAPELPLFDEPETGASGPQVSGASELFADLAGGGLTELTTAITRTARRLLDVPAPRSLCEIGISEADYEALCAWARGLSRRPLKAWITDARPTIAVTKNRRLSPQEGVGMLLLLIAAETARRKASEGRLWSEALEVYSTEAAAFLFVQRQPAWPHKEALQAAARTLDLRHVFGREGTQEYYITTYLQFGFTQSAIQRMPEWLSGFPTSEAVQHLSGGDDGSASFQELWRTLLGFRRGNISEARAREVCIGSPWLLPSWVDELLIAVRKRPNLPRAAQGADALGAGAPLLDSPRLRWELGHAPVFVTSIVNLEGSGLKEPGYSLRFEPHGVVVHLYHREDGDYDTPAEILLPADAPRYRAVLWDNEGIFVETMPLELWSPDEDVTAFDLRSGSPVDAWRSPMSPKRTYALLLASDLEITPRPAVWQAIGKTHTLYHLPSGWSEDLRVTLGGEELWTPNLARAQRPEREQPEWAGVSLDRPTQVEIGTHTPEILLRLPDGVFLDFVRLGPEPLEFHVEGAAACIESFELTAERVAGGLMATFGLRRGGRRAAALQQLPILPIGVLRYGSDGCQALCRDADLRARDLRNDALQVFMPASVGGGIVETLALVAGDAYQNISVKPFWRGLLTTPPVSWRTDRGFGAPLLVRRPYNTVDPRSAFQVARAVCDTGNIQGATFDDDGVVLTLDRPVEPGQDHRVLLWEPWQPLRTLTRDAIAMGGRHWCVPLEGAPPSVAAILYQGELVGAWGDTDGWSAALIDGLARADGKDALNTAALLRGLRLPLLHPQAQDAVRGLTEAFPMECLRAWMRGEGLPAGWDAPAEDEAWFGVVRAMFTDWQPTREDARGLLECLADADAEDPYLDVLEQMIVVHPRLAACVAAAWKEDTSVTGIGKDELAAALRRIAGLGNADDDARVRAWIAERLDTAAESMRVDPKFLENLMRPVPHHAPNRHAVAANLSIALTVSPFRRGMALHLLREV